MVKVVPSTDAHCITVSPKRVDEVVGEINALAKDAPVPRADVEKLAAAYLDQYQYAWRAWRVCGSVVTPVTP